MRRLMLVLLTMILSLVCVAGELIVVKSKNTTSEDIPLQFKLEKTKWDGDKIKIWGTVKNTGKIRYEYVKVIFTVRDSKGKFIGRNSWYAEPNTIGLGQVGYIEDDFVECEGRKPSKIEYSVVGRK